MNGKEFIFLCLKQFVVSCTVCKGRLMCGVKKCPLLERFNARQALAGRLRREVVGESVPNVFVGWNGYPRVNVGPSVSLEGASTDASQWYGKPLDEIVSSAAVMARGYQKQSVKKRLSRDLLEAAMSTKPLDVAITFEHVPRNEVRFFDVSQPSGPSAQARNIEVQGNACIPGAVDEAIEEGWTARDALTALLEKGFEYYYLQKLLTAGALGKHEDRRLVPTRWGITATDTMLANEHLNKIRESQTIDCYQVYSNEYLFNRFEIILLPGNWEYEQFEAWSKGSFWSENQSSIAYEYEPFQGRKDYAQSEGGGYYAARFAVAEALAQRNVQARVIVVREIYDGYRVPVGVWQVRENVRAAFRNKPNEFYSLSKALADAATRLKNPWRAYASKSTILKQKKLSEF